MLEVSVVLPTYNESSWLPETIRKLNKAFIVSGIKKKEIIIIDDGSTDSTGSVIKELQTSIPIQYIHQKNSGRFLARKKGIDTAKYESILFIDSRVHIGNKSIQYLASKIQADPSKTIWNAHVYVDKKGNIFARFWDAITFVAWRRYFSNPRETSYGLDEFDYFPKGTTCFMAPKKQILQAIDSFSTKSKDVKAANDDTLMIKYLAGRNRIHISPSFNCTYHSRSTLKKFLNHAYHRGQVFVDGFLRRDGNRYYWPLVGFLIFSVVVLVGSVIFPGYIKYIAALGMTLWIIGFLALLSLKVPIKDAMSLFLLAPVFALFYGLGIWRAFIARAL